MRRITDAGPKGDTSATMPGDRETPPRVPAIRRWLPIRRAVRTRTRARLRKPMLDPIVRNDARRLRFKLLEYYQQTETNVLTIDIPKGGYVPVFIEAADQQELERPELGKTHERRVAVLPFDSFSPECEMPCRALGMSLTAALTNRGGLQIVAHRFVEHQDMRQASSEFGLSHLIHGSAMREGERMRVIVNLIQAQTGTQIWAREYEAESSGLLGFYAEVAKSVSAEVASVLKLARPQLVAIARAA